MVGATGNTREMEKQEHKLIEFWNSPCFQCHVDLWFLRGRYYSSPPTNTPTRASGMLSLQCKYHANANQYQMQGLLRPGLNTYRLCQFILSEWYMWDGKLTYLSGQIRVGRCMPLFGEFDYMWSKWIFLRWPSLFLNAFQESSWKQIYAKITSCQNWAPPREEMHTPERLLERIVSQLAQKKWTQLCQFLHSEW